MPDSTPFPLSRTLREVRIRASLLMKAARAGEPVAVARLGATPKRRRALNLMAHELTAISYASLLAQAQVQSGNTADPTRIFERHVSVFCNHWFADVSEARAHHAMHGGTLFPYRRQFVIVGSELLHAVGLDPDDPDWELIGRDWTKPKDQDAFARLNAKLVAAGFGAAVHHAK